MTEPVRRSVEQIARAPHLLAEARRLSRIDNLRGGIALARQWAVILTAGGLAVWSGSPLVYLLAILVIATRQHALAVLFHDASHYRLFTNRAANDICADIFCSLPAGILMSRYRADHLGHHRAPNTSDDPYWNVFQSNPASWGWPKSRREAATVFIRDLLGLNASVASKEASTWTPWPNHSGKAAYPPPISRRDRIVTYAFYGTLFATLLIFNLWLTFFLLWMVPFMTAGQAIVRLRGMAEHFGLPDPTGTDATRHVDPYWWERLIFPLNVNCHLTHHIFPGIPCYHLAEMTEILFADREFAARAHRTPSYLGPKGVVFGELTGPNVIVHPQPAPQPAH